MKRQTLSVKNLAVVFGTFAPMHTGHVDLITKAKRDNDAVLVIVSGTNTDRDRGSRAGLHLNRRFRYVREVFRGDDLVVIDKLDEKDMPAYPNGWTPWLKALHALIQKNTDYTFDKVTFYVGEEEYQQPLLNFFETTFAKENNNKTVHVKRIERSSIPISATAIRENPFTYWRYITKPFRRHFTKKVLVVGSASGGKTTLVKDLGRVFNAPVSLEYARTYQDRYNVRDDELDVNDYVHLLADQYQQTANVIDEGSHSGLIFADTNSSVTMTYIDHYLKDAIPQHKYQMLYDLYKATVAREQWDLIILIPPKSAYVDDGFRDMTMSDQETRDAFTETLTTYLEEAGFEDKLLVLDSNANTFFADNYQRTIKAINQHLGFDI